MLKEEFENTCTGACIREGQGQRRAVGEVLKEEASAQEYEVFTSAPEALFESGFRLGLRFG